MANTIARCVGYDKARMKEVTRLGSVASEASAATWHTFAKVFVKADGSGWASAIQNGKIILEFSWNGENEPDPITLEVK